MKTIKETLDELTTEQRCQLMFAFEHAIPQHIVLPDGRFIGVHVRTINGLCVDNETDNGWAIGTIPEHKHENRSVRA
jgi:hypothetical protein